MFIWKHMRTNVKRCGGPKLIEGKKDEGDDNWEYDGVILVTSYNLFSSKDIGGETTMVLNQL